MKTDAVAKVAGEIEVQAIQASWHSDLDQAEVFDRWAATLRSAIAQSEGGEVVPFGHYFRDAAGNQHFHTGAKVPPFAQNEITPLFAHPAKAGGDVADDCPVAKIPIWTMKGPQKTEALAPSGGSVNAKPPENYSWKCDECGYVGLAAEFPVDTPYFSNDGDVRCPKCGSPNTDEAPTAEWPDQPPAPASGGDGLAELRENYALGKKQWDEVAAILGADGDNVDAVIAAAKRLATLATRDGVCTEYVKGWPTGILGLVAALRYAAVERDNRNRIRQFDEIMAAAEAFITAAPKDEVLPCQHDWILTGTGFTACRKCMEMQ